LTFSTPPCASNATATAEAVVLDTDVVSGLMRDTLPAAVAQRIEGLTPCVTFVTAGELFRGATHAGWGTRRAKALEHWLEHVIVIPADRAVARRWGELTGGSLRAGAPLPANDAWIAACCLTHDTPLATLNSRHFTGIDSLQLITGA
jgi:predicted nucleic acid-binding protein